MTDYTELVKALRHCKIHLPCKECPRYGSTGNLCVSDLHDDAAAAIETLEGLIATYRFKVKCLNQNRGWSVELVRCEECIHKTDEYANGEIWCDEHGQYHKNDWFCADGEREVQE